MGDRIALVTGATGFIGRWSLHSLLERGYRVHVVASSSRPIAELEGSQRHVADLRDPAAVTALLQKIRPTHLLHFAWIATPGSYWTSLENYDWVLASLRLLREFHRTGGQRVVMAGSCAEYDWTRGPICREGITPLANHRGEAVAPYAAAKIALQGLLAAYSRHERLSAAWGRIFFQYGPYEHPSRLVASVIRSLLAGDPAETSHGRQVRSFLHVADVGGAFSALLDSDVVGAVNIASAEESTIEDIVRMIARLVGRPELLRLGALSTSPAEPSVLLADTRRLTQEVGWRPSRTLEQGIAQTIEWWKTSSRRF